MQLGLIRHPGAAARRQGGAAGVRRRPRPDRGRRLAISVRRDGGDGDDLIWPAAPAPMPSPPPAMSTICVVDAGVAADLPAHPRPDRRQNPHGHRQCGARAGDDAGTGRRRAGAGLPDRRRRRSTRGADIIALGEMGIGNTASSALLVHRLAPAPLARLHRRRRRTGRRRHGAQARGDRDGRGAQRRHRAVRRASRIRRAGNRDDGRRGARRGIAAPAGDCRRIHLQRRGAGRDPAVSGGARLLRLRASLRRDAATTSCSTALEAKPLLDLGLRLGEGTGALLAVPLVRAAARLLTDVADLERRAGRKHLR